MVPTPNIQDDSLTLRKISGNGQVVKEVQFNFLLDNGTFNET